MKNSLEVSGFGDSSNVVTGCSDWEVWGKVLWEARLILEIGMLQKWENLKHDFYKLLSSKKVNFLKMEKPWD